MNNEPTPISSTSHPSRISGTPIGDQLPRRGNALSRAIALGCLALMGWRIELNAPNLPKFLFVGAPHTSNWDFVLTLIAIFALSIRISWMGKHTLFRWPLGGLMRWFGGVPINRKEGGGVVDATIEAFNSRPQFIIAIMPEGTRRRVKEWKTGFYHIAQKANVPVVLVIFDYAQKCLRIGPAIDLTGDMAADIAYIQSFYKNVQGKYPEQFNLS